MRRFGPPSCRQVRALLQTLADARAHPAAAPELAAESHPAESLPAAAAAHLSGCPGCRRFRDLLDDYPRRLASALAVEVRDLPAPDLAAAAARRQPLPPLQPILAGPRGPWKRLRWVLPSAAAALAALAVGLPLAVAQARTLRGIHLQMSAVVDRAFARPLADGVEGELARVAGPDRVLEELEALDSLGAEVGLQGLGEEAFPE